MHVVPNINTQVHFAPRYHMIRFLLEIEHTKIVTITIGNASSIPTGTSYSHSILTIGSMLTKNGSKSVHHDARLLTTCIITKIITKRFTLHISPLCTTLSRRKKYSSASHAWNTTKSSLNFIHSKRKGKCK